MDAAEKSELLEAAQHELMNHHWDIFCTEPLSIAEGGKGVIAAGCVHCRKLLYTGNPIFEPSCSRRSSTIIDRVIANSSDT
jgi:hypothetical protein